MSSTKVFVETSVLISASVYATSKDLNVELVHHFYNISIPLFGFFREHIDERIGITTATVEDEARTSLTKAIIETLKERAEAEPSKRDELFKACAAFLDASFDNLGKNLAVLLREPVLGEERDKTFPEVSKMYYDLESKEVIGDVKEVAKAMAQYAPPRFRKTAEGIYRDQLFEESQRQIPLKRLRRKPVGERDKKILAEAVYILERYKKREAITMFFASTDCHFSPVRGVRTMTTVTDEIEKRFGIICDWPDRVLQKIAAMTKKAKKRRK
jgi:hypothetical protein